MAPEQRDSSAGPEGENGQQWSEEHAAHVGEDGVEDGGAHVAARGQGLCHADVDGAGQHGQHQQTVSGWLG